MSSKKSGHKARLIWHNVRLGGTSRKVVSAQIQQVQDLERRLSVEQAREAKPTAKLVPQCCLMNVRACMCVTSPFIQFILFE